MNRKLATVTSSAPPAPTAGVDTLTALDELAGGILDRMYKMSEGSRRILETAMHDTVNKTLLYRGMLAAHRIKEHGKLLSAISLCEEHLRNPDYIMAVASEPAALYKHYDLLLKAEKLSRDYMKEQIADTLDRQGQTGGYDPTSSVHIHLGAAEAVVPEEFKNVDTRRRIQSAFNIMLMAIHSEAPTPPKATSRVLRTDVIDVEHTAVEEENDDRQQPSG